MPWLIGLVILYVLLSWKPFVIFLELLFWIGIAYAIRRYRLTIAGWVYALTPHPAARVVQEAVRTGKPLDVAGFKQALAYEPKNEAERIVRTRQLAEATRAVAAHDAYLGQELTKLRARAEALADERAHAARRYQMGEAEEKLLKAALAHEITAAHVTAQRDANDHD